LNGFPAYGSGTGDTNGSGARINVVWGIGNFELVTAGDYTAVPAVHTPTVRVSGATPAVAAQVDVYYGVKTLGITQKGSGYTSPADAVPTFSTVTGDEVRATGAAVLTTDSGVVGSATNQENAIIIRANLGEGVEIGDIIRQVSNRRYKVRLAVGGVGIVELESGDNTPNLGKAMIIATATGGTYYVTKLTARKATLVTKTGDGVLNGKAVRWTFGANSATTVTIENA
jgi:hypothetical protein